LTSATSSTLPCGHEPALRQRAAKTILGNWQLSTIVSYRSGNHFSALGGTDSSLTGIKQDRADLIADPKFGSCPGGQVGSSTCFFNTSAFTNAAAGSFGNSGRNMLVGPATSTSILAFHDS